MMNHVNEEAQNMKNWIVLDNGSTVDLFSNQNLVHNIRKTKDIMELHPTWVKRKTI